MTTTTDFTVGDRAYRAERLSAMDQFHLSRKLAPLLPPLAPLFIKAIDEGAPGGLTQNLLAFIELAEPFAEALSELKDETAEQLMNMTLASVKIETVPGTWTPLWLPGAKMATVIELNDLGKLLPIVLKVIDINLRPFIEGFLTRREEPSQKESSGENSPEVRTGSLFRGTRTNARTTS